MALESLADMASRLAAGDVSARETAEASIALLDAAAQLGAVAFRDDDVVLAHASTLDEAFRSDGPVGPLHGVPVTIKDWIDTTGFPCAAGQAAHIDRRPARDASVVARLRAAGAVVVAKSSIGP